MERAVLDLAAGGRRDGGFAVSAIDEAALRAWLEERLLKGDLELEYERLWGRGRGRGTGETPVEELVRRFLLDSVIGITPRALAGIHEATVRAPGEALPRFLYRERFSSAGADHPEASFVVPLCIGRGLDVGCGPRKTHPDCTGVDLTPGGVAGGAGSARGKPSQADIHASGDDLSMIPDDSQDFVVQRHNLEHYVDPLKALEEWWRVLVPGGWLGMVVPDETHLDTISLDPTHKHVFTPASLRHLMDILGGWDSIHLEDGLYHWSFVLIARKADGGAEDERVAHEIAARRDAGRARQVRHAGAGYALAGVKTLADACEGIAASLDRPGVPLPRWTGGDPAPRPVPEVTSFFPTAGARLRYRWEELRGAVRRRLKRLIFK